MAPWRRRRPPPKKPWRFDWRNPDMLVVTRMLYQDPMGFVQKGPTEEVDPEYMQDAARDSMRHSPTPKWREDPSYNWSKRKK